MQELIIEIAIYLGVATFLGFVLGYLIWGLGHRRRIEAARAEGAADVRTSVDGDSSLRTQIETVTRERDRLANRVEVLSARLAVFLEQRDAPEGAEALEEELGTVHMRVDDGADDRLEAAAAAFPDPAPDRDANADASIFLARGGDAGAGSGAPDMASDTADPDADHRVTEEPDRMIGPGARSPEEASADAEAAERLRSAADNLKAELDKGEVAAPQSPVGEDPPADPFAADAGSAEDKLSEAPLDDTAPGAAPDARESADDETEAGAAADTKAVPGADTAVPEAGETGAAHAVDPDDMTAAESDRAVDQDDERAAITTAPAVPPGPGTADAGDGSAGPSDPGDDETAVPVSGETPGLAPDETFAPDAVETDAPTQTVAPDARDDLTRIKGIGRSTARALNANGIWQFSQLAGLSADEAADLKSELGNQMSRSLEKWIDQARDLSEQSGSDGA